jgi:hypothetical protein
VSGAWLARRQKWQRSCLAPALEAAEIANVWGVPEKVARNSKVYVDQKVIVVAIGEQIERRVNSNCKPGWPRRPMTAMSDALAGVAQW